ncbi:hypothetical protein WJ42_28790 [Burkholderia cepacia]|nr:hypothetical protein WJ42_28790 [Burkholderia cepacia]KWC70864.1 hypothetical protein WL55_12080 [Burkholderia cepacia]
MLNCTPSAAPLPDIASKRFGRTRVRDAARFVRSVRQRTATDGTPRCAHRANALHAALHEQK